MLRYATIRRFSLPSAAILGLALAACADSSPPTSTVLRHVAAQHATLDENAKPGEPNAGNGDTKAFIGAWLNGEAVELRYTRSFYCEEPPESIADSHCEIGALPQDFPRGGPILKIYALAPGPLVMPDPATLHSRAHFVSVEPDRGQSDSRDSAPPAG
jgi:hypothetical protein